MHADRRGLSCYNRKYGTFRKPRTFRVMLRSNTSDLIGNSVSRERPESLGTADARANNYLNHFNIRRYCCWCLFEQQPRARGWGCFGRSDTPQNVCFLYGQFTNSILTLYNTLIDGYSVALRLRDTGRGKINI